MRALDTCGQCESGRSSSPSASGPSIYISTRIRRDTPCVGAAMTHAALVLQISAILAVTAAPTRTVHAQNWQQFRGPHAGVARDDPRLPDTWTTTENVAWRIDIPGRSWSSPVVWDDHAFVVTAVNAKN